MSKAAQNSGSMEEQHSFARKQKEGADIKHTGRCSYNCSVKRELQIESQQV